jgi:probable blue pigment (indigoidine) exporter
VDTSRGRAWHDIGLTALAPASWGTTYIVTTTMLPPDRPLLAATLRALPAGLLLVALTRRVPQGSWWWRTTVLGVLNFGAFFPLLFFGAYRLPGGIAAIAGVTLLTLSPISASSAPRSPTLSGFGASRASPPPRSRCSGSPAR